MNDLIKGLCFVVFFLVVIFGGIYLLNRYTDYRYASVEIHSSGYSYAKHTAEDYPQLKPLIEESMKDGILSRGEYDEINRQEEAIRFKKNKQELIDYLKESDEKSKVPSVQQTV